MFSCSAMAWTSSGVRSQKPIKSASEIILTSVSSQGLPDRTRLLSVFNLTHGSPLHVLCSKCSLRVDNSDRFLERNMHLRNCRAYSHQPAPAQIGSSQGDHSPGQGLNSPLTKWARSDSI